MSLHRVRNHVEILILIFAAMSLSAATATNLVPASAPHGARVIVAGTGLDSGGLTVSFPTAGGTVNATIVSRSASLVEVVVPASAVGGQVVVENNGATTGSFSFSVANDPAFTTVVTLAASDKAHDLFKQPSGIAVIASSGVVVVADSAHDQLSLISASGQVAVLAGSGKPGFTDGAGAEAQFKNPGGIAVDQTTGVIYLADTGNNVIRKVTLGGAVTTFAGSGRPDDNDGSGALASFKQPVGLAIDPAGNVYVADTGNSKIRMITPAGVVTTLAGSSHEGFADGPVGQALFKQPEGIAVSSTGALIVSDTKNNIIRKIEGGVVSTIAGTGHGGFVDGSGAIAEFKEPSAISLDDADNAIVADAKNHAIRKVSLFPSVTVSTIAGTGKPGAADGELATSQFKEAAGVAFAGAIFVADTGNDAARVIRPATGVTAIWPRRGLAAGGNMVRVFGTGFVPGAITVMIGDHAASTITFVSSTEITATVPAGSGTGLAVSITTAAGTSTLANAYSYIPPPTIASLAPAKGPTAGGTVVTIVGTNFLDGGDTQVRFGAASAAVAVQSSNTLTAVAPPGSVGAVDVRLTTIGGETVVSNAYTYFAPPTITSFSPASGKAGTVVTIYGTNFDSVAPDNSVRFGAISTAVTSATATQLVVTVPQGAVSAPISVTTVGGSVQSAASFAIVSYVSLTISPDPASVDIGSTLQLTARGVAADGSMTDLTSQVAWSSGAPSFASVNGSGRVSGLATGSASITATLAALSKTVTVAVQAAEALPPDPSLVATPLNQHSIAPFGEGVKFLFTGPNSIQNGVASGAISDERIAVVRGKTTTRDGSLLSGVRVRVLNHPEFGYTLSRADAVFDLAVNGGGALTIVYEKKGYLSAQRTIDVPWQDFVWAPEVALIPSDSAVTTVDLTSPRVQTARGSVVSDGNGLRQTTLLFPSGTTASLKMPDGSVRAVTTLNVRATEYTVGSRGPNAMPAALPPGVAYTFCVDLSADEVITAGATSITFTKPVSVYVENFLQFPAGTRVPTASYDTIQGRWVAEQDARVIRIVSITAGAADIDINGDGVADSDASLAPFGFDLAERQQLASLYAAGQTLWRFRAPHFTPWDANPALVLPDDAENPDLSADTAKHLNSCCPLKGSIIEAEEQTVGEAIPITGSPFSLVYNSSRVTGRSLNRSLDLTVSNVPPSALGVSLVVSIAGTLQTLNTPSTGSVTQRIDWDGKDAYGRTYPGSVTAHVVANANYPVHYARPTFSADGTPNWGKLAAPSQLIGSPNRADVYAQMTTYGAATIGDAHTAGEGGWMLDVEEHYDTASRTLYEGDGPRRSASDVADGILRRVAGSGRCCYNGEGISALDAQLNFPFAVKIAADGSIYLAESRRVRVVSPGGSVRTIAGNGTCCYSGDGGPATSAQINVADIAVGDDGTVYIADFSNRVRVVKNGTIATIAGTGLCCSSGDDGPALNAKVSPQGITVGSDGTIYIAERGSNASGVIRRITSDGIISKYALAGDVRGLTSGADGSLYFTDFAGGQVFRIRNDGRTELVAGNSNCSSNFVIGDGGKALDACLNGPWYVTADRSGTVFVAEQKGARIRALTPDGIIRTVAGIGQTRGAKLKDVLPATASVTDSPFGIAAHPNGNIYFADWDLDVLWRIEPKFPGGSVGGEILIPSEDGSTVSVFHGSQHVRTVDALTGVTLLSFAYDNELRLISVTDADGNTTAFERDNDGNLTGAVAPNGQRTGIATTQGLITRITDPANGEHRFTYQDGALMRSMTTPRGMSTTFDYDAQGRLSRDTDAASGFQSFVRTGTSNHFIVNHSTAESRTRTYDVQYAADGAVKRTVTTSAGEIDRINIDANGNRTVVTPDGTIETTSFGPDSRFGMVAHGSSTSTLTTGGLTLSTSTSRQVTLSNPNDLFSLSSLVSTLTLNGRTWQSSWDAPTRAVIQQSPVGRISKTTLDAKGRVATLELPGIVPVAFSYDSAGRLTTIQQGPRTSTFTYDTLQYLASVTDPLHRAVRFKRDNLGRVIAQTLPDGTVIGYSYDADGNLTALTPPARPSHVFSPTPVNLLAGYTPPAVAGTEATGFTYNRDRQLTTVVLPGAISIGLSYDAAARLSDITTPSDAYRYTYAPGSGVLSSIDFSGGASLGYTYTGSLLKSVTWAGLVQGTVNYTYDNSFRVASINGIPLSYDNDDLLTGAGQLLLSRDAQSGRLVGVSLASIVDAWTYNEFGEISSYSSAFQGNPAYAENVARDDAGRITTRDEMLLGGTSHSTYTYDIAGNLATVIRDGASVSYGYDPNGNRATVISNAGAESSTYDTQDRLLTRGGVGYTYASNGELKSKTDANGTTTFEYDALGNLRRVALPTGTLIEYVIDGQNRRVGKKINGSLVAAWLYSDELRLAAELDGNGTVVSQFVYASRANIPDYMIRAGVTYRIIADHLGSPRAVINAATGSIAQMMGYDEFGSVLGDTNPGFQPFGFAGGLYDSDTKLVRFGARDYDSEAGRWTAKDPLAFGGGDTNLYGYSLGDPINFRDSDGLLPHSTIGGDDPGLTPEERKKLEQKLRDPNTPAREREQIKRRLRELDRKKSKRQQHHCDVASVPEAQPGTTHVPTIGVKDVLVAGALAIVGTAVQVLTGGRLQLQPAGVLVPTTLGPRYPSPNGSGNCGGCI